MKQQGPGTAGALLLLQSFTVLYSFRNLLQFFTVFYSFPIYFSSMTRLTSGIPLNSDFAMPISVNPCFLYMARAGVLISLVSIRSSQQPIYRA